MKFKIFFYTGIIFGVLFIGYFLGALSWKGQLSYVAEDFSIITTLHEGSRITLVHRNGKLDSIEEQGYYKEIENDKFMYIGNDIPEAEGKVFKWIRIKE